MVSADARLDASGLPCPHPVLRARRALKPLAPGQVLEVIATDPDAPEDFRVFAARGGHELLLSERAEEGHYRFLLRKGA